MKCALILSSSMKSKGDHSSYSHESFVHSDSRLSTCDPRQPYSQYSSPSLGLQTVLRTPYSRPQGSYPANVRHPGYALYHLPNSWESSLASCLLVSGLLHVRLLGAGCCFCCFSLPVGAVMLWQLLR
ncbi:uncharacterized protein LOC110694507 [Chenopodium quinoa]|uniref:uncharacterized protein LOC110694507 n=1 Tax=Chenopodium quinoa TaxID=63459 RepID=UPI000B7879DD|nr:uncharacterized protein LOC110694507 [Chenopodium quinoa]XP_021727387.1 uncharacterized protein LOC110694507 [Chenopodium quinoa]